MYYNTESEISGSYNILLRMKNPHDAAKIKNACGTIPLFGTHPYICYSKRAIELNLKRMQSNSTTFDRSIHSSPLEIHLGGLHSASDVDFEKIIKTAFSEFGEVERAYVAGRKFMVVSLWCFVNCVFFPFNFFYDTYFTFLHR